MAVSLPTLAFKCLKLLTVFTEVDPKAGGGAMMNMGQLVKNFLTKLEWYSSLFPRIPVPIQKDIDRKLNEKKIFDASQNYEEGAEDNYEGSCSAYELSPEKPTKEDENNDGRDRYQDKDKSRDQHKRERSRDHHERDKSRDHHERDKSRDRHEGDRSRDRHERDSRDRCDKDRRRNDRYRRRSRERSRHGNSRNGDISEQIEKEKERQRRDRDKSDRHRRSRSRDRSSRKSHKKRRSRSRSRDKSSK